MATGTSTTELDEDRNRDDHDPDHAEERPRALEREPVGAERADPLPAIDFHHRPGGGRDDQGQAEQGQGGPDHEDEEHEHPAALAVGRDPRDARRMDDDRLQEGHEDGDRQEHEADTEEHRRVPGVHPCRRGEDLAPRAAARQTERRRRPPRRTGEPVENERQERPECQQNGERVVDRPPQRGRAPADRGAEEVGRRRPKGAACRNRVALVPPVRRHGDGLGPRGLEIRAGRTVEEGSLELTPASLEPDPREQGASFGGVARDRPHDRLDVEARPVVSSQPTPCSAELPRKSAGSKKFACDPAAG